MKLTDQRYGMTTKALVQYFIPKRKKPDGIATYNVMGNSAYILATLLDPRIKTGPFKGINLVVI